MPYYRKALHEELAERVAKNPKYSLRSFARYLNIEPSALSQILNGKRYPSLERIEHFFSKLDLTPEQQEQFKFTMAEAKKNAGHQRFTQEMKDILNNSASGNYKKDNVKELSINAFKIISDWHHHAILELTFVKNFKSDPDWIAKRLGISASEAKLAIERLLSLELVSEENGVLKKTTAQLRSADKHLTTAAHRRRQKQILEKSIISLENDPIEKRNHTAMTFAIDETKLPEAKKRIQEFTRELTEFLESGNQTKVYEMVVNLIPLENIKE